MCETETDGSDIDNAPNDFCIAQKSCNLDRRQLFANTTGSPLGAVQRQMWLVACLLACLHTSVVMVGWSVGRLVGWLGECAESYFLSEPFKEFCHGANHCYRSPHKCRRSAGKVLSHLGVSGGIRTHAQDGRIYLQTIKVVIQRGRSGRGQRMAAGSRTEHM